MGAERNYSCYGENELGEGGGGFCLTGAELWKTFAAVDSNSNGNSKTVGAAHPRWGLSAMSAS